MPLCHNYWPYVLEPASPHAATTEVCLLWSPYSTAREVTAERSWRPQLESSPCSLQLEKHHVQQQRPSTTKKEKKRMEVTWQNWISLSHLAGSGRNRGRKIFLEFARASVTKYHRLSGLNNRTLFSLSSGGEQCENRVLAGFISPEASWLTTSHCVLTRPFLCTWAPIGVSLYVLIASSFEGTSQIGLGPTLIV